MSSFQIKHRVIKGKDGLEKTIVLNAIDQSSSHQHLYSIQTSGRGKRDIFNVYRDEKEALAQFSRVEQEIEEEEGCSGL